MSSLGKKNQQNTKMTRKYIQEKEGREGEILFTLKKEENSDTGYNMDEPWTHYAKWKKLVTKGQIVWFHLMRYLLIGPT